MSLNINEFTSAFQGGGVRANLFRVTINDLGPKFGFLCKATALPEATIGIAPVPYMGREIKLAGNRTFADWNCTVYMDTDYDTKNRLEEWMDKINSHEGNVGVTNIMDYFANAVIEQIDRDGSVIKTIEVQNIWPTVMAEVAMDWSANDAIAEQEITFCIGTFWKTSHTT